jgi:hypothetical protein
MRLLWLPDVLRDEGLRVITAPGWQTRGREFTREIEGVIGHHTASNRRSGNLPSHSICITGRPDLPGPLCSILGGRDGTVDVIASGIGNHAGSGAWPGIRLGNSDTIGIEWENDGIGEPWTIPAIDAFERTVTALLRHLDRGAERFCSHYEWARPVGRKIDPRGDWIGGGDWYSGGVPRVSWSARMFRARVAARLDEEDDLYTEEDRERDKRIEKKLDDFFGIDEAGNAKDIRKKIDQTFIHVSAEDHRDLIAGRVAAIDVATNPDAPPPRD